MALPETRGFSQPNPGPPHHAWPTWATTELDKADQPPPPMRQEDSNIQGSRASLTLDTKAVTLEEGKAALSRHLLQGPGVPAQNLTGKSRAEDIRGPSAENAGAIYLPYGSPQGHLTHQPEVGPCPPLNCHHPPAKMWSSPQCSAQEDKEGTAEAQSSFLTRQSPQPWLRGPSHLSTPENWEHTGPSGTQHRKA